MKLLGAETHFPSKEVTNAADYLRTISPLMRLQEHTSWKIELRRALITEEAAKDIRGPLAMEQWMQLGRSYDLVYYSYNTNPLNFSHAHVITRKFGHTVVMDFDDNLLSPDMANPTEIIARMDGKKHDLANEVVVEEVPYMTVTTEYLKKCYSDFLRERGIKKDIYVLPNAIDSKLYTPVTEKTENKELVIGFFGSTSHQADLYEKHFHKGLSQILKEHKNVRFEVIGNFIPDYLKSLGKFTLIAGNTNYFDWIEIWKKHVTKWDIGLAPLRDIVFNRSRSDIKFQEYALAQVPMIASDIGLYDKKFTLLAKTSKDWYEQLSTLITRPEVRQEMGLRAKEYVLANRTIDTRWTDWKEVFEEIYQKQQIAS